MMVPVTTDPSAERSESDRKTLPAGASIGVMTAVAAWPVRDGQQPDRHGGEPEAPGVS